MLPKVAPVLGSTSPGTAILVTPALSFQVKRPMPKFTVPPTRMEEKAIVPLELTCTLLGLKKAQAIGAPSTRLSSTRIHDAWSLSRLGERRPSGSLTQRGSLKGPVPSRVEKICAQQVVWIKNRDGHPRR